MSFKKTIFAEDNVSDRRGRKVLHNLFYGISQNSLLHIIFGIYQVCPGERFVWDIPKLPNVLQDWDIPRLSVVGISQSEVIRNVLDE